MNRDLFDFFVKSEKPREFCVTSFGTWWGCLYETFLYILNHLLLLWRCLLDSIRFISSSEEHCSVEKAETAALCNFVIALIYSEFCFKTPTVKYKVEKTINVKAFSTLVFLRIQLVGCVRKQANVVYCCLLSDFLELLKMVLLKMQSVDPFSVVSPPLPSYFSHMVKHLSVSKQSYILSSTAFSLLALSQIAVKRYLDMCCAICLSSFLTQDYRVWFHWLSWSDCRVWCRKCINPFYEGHFMCQQDASCVFLLLTRISNWLLFVVLTRLERECRKRPADDEYWLEPQNYRTG